MADSFLKLRLQDALNAVVFGRPMHRSQGHPQAAAIDVLRRMHMYMCGRPAGASTIQHWETALGRLRSQSDWHDFYFGAGYTRVRVEISESGDNLNINLLEGADVYANAFWKVFTRDS